MFKPEEMAKIEVLSLNRYKDSILTYLHEQGVLEIREIDVDLAQKDAPNEFYRKAASYSISLSRLIDFLKSYKEQETGGVKGFIFPELKPKKKYKYRGIEALIKEIESFLENAEPEIKSVEGKITSLNTEIERLKTEIEILELLSALDIEVEYLKPTKSVEIVVGFVEKDKFLPLIEELKKALNDRLAYVSRDLKGKVLVAIALLKKDYDKANPILAKYSFERIEVPDVKGKPRDAIKTLQKEIARLNKELEVAEKEARVLAEKYHDELVFYQELMENEREKANMLSNLVRTNMTFALTGWLPRKEVPKILEGLNKISRGKIYVNVRSPTPEELDEIPVKLKNPKFIEPFEMLTEMFGVPKYNELDPTPILAFTYSFFFGFMLTDFMYGLIIAVVAALLTMGHKKLNDGVYKFSNILLWSSFFTIVMGILFGSYFGDAFQRAGINVPALLDPMRGALVVLGLALAIGLLHLFIGYTLGFIVKIKNKETANAVLEQLPWMLIILGVIFLALSIAGFTSIVLGEAFLLPGIVLFVIAEIRSDLPVLMRLLMTISDFFGFIGNWLSYARLMALALATAGIAMVVNIIVAMIWGIKIGPVPLGIAVGLVVFIGGHIFSTAINALGAFVHALRLHYVEFFGTFYSGEGKRFEPFKAKREVSELELEI
ncbi:V-type ATP synthase subunit I [Thermococcus litoralis DSM 5473]|uniref:A-type ATP synthase subunit I n=1 Tax=Thermococcus litoralis (strain ATCC 51850 / DSM 5473 / JCM 8560 / NS-C) TaxID=523849 RepID=H3ZKG4_THELN|nr:V-type ATP synthase subunit I [Thermococcus litoralis]EHR79566.1 V-type ATP synthase subunit I [Thermococcus litoralis DSM 5473]